MLVELGYGWHVRFWRAGCFAFCPVLSFCAAFRFADFAWVQWDEGTTGVNRDGGAGCGRSMLGSLLVGGGIRARSCGGACTCIRPDGCPNRSDGAGGAWTFATTEEIHYHDDEAHDRKLHATVEEEGTGEVNVAEVAMEWC